MKVYSVVDHPNLRERRELGWPDRCLIGMLLTKRLSQDSVARTVAVATGEKRPPKAGEWFLSGAIVEAYKAANDLSSPYPIAQLTVVIETNVKRYDVVNGEDLQALLEQLEFS